jgi:hypothetical protein
MRDPQADIARRAWTACPLCVNHEDCDVCEAGHTCEWHWRYLLAAEGRQLFLQCPTCWHRWWHDTYFGVGDRPAHITAESDLLGWPKAA